MPIAPPCGAGVTGPSTVVPEPPTHVPVAVGAGLTHRGRIRERNEDAILTDPSGHLWAVADGMGGYGHGDVAADIVIDHLELVQDDALTLDGLKLRLAEANDAVRTCARDKGFMQMGATVVALVVRHAVARVVWAGDSRAYLYRNHHLRMLTRDHTVVQELVDQGHLSPSDADHHPESHIVTRAVGGDAVIEPDGVSLPLCIGDRLMLCSDGLPRCVYEPDMARLLEAAATPDEACQALVREALENGAPDNVSVIVVDMRKA